MAFGTMVPLPLPPACPGSGRSGDAESELMQVKRLPLHAADVKQFRITGSSGILLRTVRRKDRMAPFPELAGFNHCPELHPHW